MSILRSQEQASVISVCSLANSELVPTQHWNDRFPGGSAALLNLNPRLLLRIANLCLDGNCIPSDFQTEVGAYYAILDVLQRRLRKNG